jgi:hypothetical protein
VCLWLVNRALSNVLLRQSLDTFCFKQKTFAPRRRVPSVVGRKLLLRVVYGRKSNSKGKVVHSPLAYLVGKRECYSFDLKSAFKFFPVADLVIIKDDGLSL